MPRLYHYFTPRQRSFMCSMVTLLAPPPRSGRDWYFGDQTSGQLVGRALLAGFEVVA